MPNIPFDKSNPSFYTKELSVNENHINKLMKLPYIKLVGSDQGCGCGFRHAMYEDNRWINVVDDDETPFDNSNHEKLVDYISKHVQGKDSFELLVLWASDAYPIEHRQTLKLNSFIDPKFHFRERGLYTVEI